MISIAKYRGKHRLYGGWAHGYYCMIQGKHYLIPDQAETCTHNYRFRGLVEVDPDTVELVEAKTCEK